MEMEMKNNTTEIKKVALRHLAVNVHNASAVTQPRTGESLHFVRNWDELCLKVVREFVDGTKPSGQYPLKMGEGDFTEFLHWSDTVGTIQDGLWFYNLYSVLAELCKGKPKKFHGDTHKMNRLEKKAFYILRQAIKREICATVQMWLV